MPPMTAPLVARSPPSRVAVSARCLPVTGQDAEIAAIQRILAGDQALARSTRPSEARRPRAPPGRDRSPPAGPRPRPRDKGRRASDLAPGHCRDRDNIADTIIRDGFHRPLTSAPVTTRPRAPLPDQMEVRPRSRRQPPMRSGVTDDHHLSSSAVLSMTGISKRFGAVQTLKDIGFDVPRRWWPWSATMAQQVHTHQAIAGVYQPTKDTSPSTARTTISSPAEAQRLGIATVFRTSPCATTSTSSPISSSAAGRLDRHARRSVAMEKSPGGLLRELSAKIPSVRPIASLSGGQRQTVASPGRCWASPRWSCSTSRRQLSASPRRPRCSI